MEKTKAVIIFDLEGTVIDSSTDAPFETIKSVLPELSKNYLLLLWTLRERHSSIEILKQFDLSQYFVEFYCADDDFRKPYPSESLKELIENYSHRFMVGDNPVDLHAARSLKAHFIAAGWNNEIARNFSKQGHDQKFSRLPLDGKELIKGIKELISKGNENV